MSHGLVIAQTGGEVPVIETLMRRFEFAYPPPVSTLVAEMLTPIVLRLGLPAELVHEPPNWPTLMGPMLGSSQSVFRIDHLRLSLAALLDREVGGVHLHYLMATFDLEGKPRILEAARRDLHTYREHGFTTLLLEHSGDGTVRMNFNTDGGPTVPVDDLLFQLCWYIEKKEMFKARQRVTVVCVDGAADSGVDHVARMLQHCIDEKPDAVSHVIPGHFFGMDPERFIAWASKSTLDKHVWIVTHAPVAVDLDRVSYEVRRVWVFDPRTATPGKARTDADVQFCVANDGTVKELSRRVCLLAERMLSGARSGYFSGENSER